MTPSDPTVRSESDRGGLDRRQLLRVGAWAAPAIALAAAVPAASASNAATTIAPGAITLTALCAKTGGTALNAKTKHGFTVTNTSTITGTIVLTFNAQAWGLGDVDAKANLISATTTNLGAAYGPAVNGKTYQAIWGADSAITLATSSGGGGKNAKRTGTATIVLAPGQSATFWQENVNASGEPKIEARVSSINGTSVSGASAQFSFAWGGLCSA